MQLALSTFLPFHLGAAVFRAIEAIAKVLLQTGLPSTRRIISPSDK